MKWIRISTFHFSSVTLWDQASPFTKSVKLLIKDWSETIRRESKDSLNAEISHKKESHSNDKYGYKDILRSVTRDTMFSYVTNSVNLPPTNLKGKCRSFSAPKRVFASPINIRNDKLEVKRS